MDEAASVPSGSSKHLTSTSIEGKDRGSFLLPLVAKSEPFVGVVSLLTSRVHRFIFISRPAGIMNFGTTATLLVFTAALSAAKGFAPAAGRSLAAARSRYVSDMLQIYTQDTC